VALFNQQLRIQTSPYLVKEVVKDTAADAQICVVVFFIYHFSHVKLVPKDVVTIHPETNFFNFEVSRGRLVGVENTFMLVKVSPAGFGHQKLLVCELNLRSVAMRH